MQLTEEQRAQLGRLTDAGFSVEEFTSDIGYDVLSIMVPKLRISEMLSYHSHTREAATYYAAQRAVDFDAFLHKFFKRLERAVRYEILEVEA